MASLKASAQGVRVKSSHKRLRAHELPVPDPASTDVEEEEEESKKTSRNVKQETKKADVEEDSKKAKWETVPLPASADAEDE